MYNNEGVHIMMRSISKINIRQVFLNNRSSRKISIEKVRTGKHKSSVSRVQSRLKLGSIDTRDNGSSLVNFYVVIENE